MQRFHVSKVSLNTLVRLFFGAVGTTAMLVAKLWSLDSQFHPSG